VVITQLAKLQRTFQDCVLHPDKSTPTASISASGRAAPETQISIYTFAYAARLTEVLANDYPAVLMAIGDEQFNRLAYDYIQAHPSHYFSLRDFGCHFAGFIAEEVQTHKSLQHMHWLYELALFEWTLGKAFDAADVTVFTEEDMIAIPPEAWPELKFIVHPSINRLELEWNIPEIWQVLTSDDPAQVIAQRDTPGPWLVWREQLVTRFRSMQTDEQLALDALREGKSFNDVCEVLTMQMSEDKVPLRAASLLKGWISQGLISGAV